MKIVGINTSPRKGSNSRIALVKALETAKSKGADTVIYDLNDMNIRTCQADNYCVDNNGKCILDDDLQDVYKSIDEAYGVILATPIYMGNVSSLAKIFIDRLHCLLRVDNLRDKKFSIIASQAAIEPPMYEYIKNNLDITSDIFQGIGFELEDVVLLIGNEKEEAILNKKDQLDKAVMVGNKITR